jgi:hypothetical protein
MAVTISGQITMPVRISRNALSSGIIRITRPWRRLRCSNVLCNIGRSKTPLPEKLVVLDISTQTTPMNPRHLARHIYSEKVWVIDQWGFILQYSDIWSVDSISWIREDIQEGDDHKRQSAEVLPEAKGTEYYR